MKRSILFLLLLVCLCAHADSFTQKGIVYEILSETESTCAVVGHEAGVSSFDTNGFVAHEGKTYKVIRVENEAFSGCNSLRRISIGNGVEHIGDGAFARCSALRIALMYEGVKYIGSSAFEDCTNLTSVNIPCGVTTLNARTFAGCCNLPRVTLSPNINTIGDEAFRGSLKLTSIDLPTRLMSIGRSAFEDCSDLCHVRMGETVETGDDAFARCHPDLQMETYGEVACHPFCEEGKVWIVERKTITGQTELWEYRMHDHVTIGGRECYVCSLTGNAGFNYAVYEENGRVFVLHDFGDNPRLLYDFTLPDGAIFRMESGAVDWTDFRLESNTDFFTPTDERLKSYTPVSQCTSSAYQELIASKDYTAEEVGIIESNYRQVRESEWIEGIGSLYNPFAPKAQSGASFQLLACYMVEDGKVLYVREGYEHLVTGVVAMQSAESRSQRYDLAGRVSAQQPQASNVTRPHIYIEDGRCVVR